MKASELIAFLQTLDEDREVFTVCSQGLMKGETNYKPYCENYVGFMHLYPVNGKYEQCHSDEDIEENNGIPCIII